MTAIRFPRTPLTRRRSRLRLSPLSWIGVTGASIVLLIAMLGPFFAPYAPEEILGRAYQHPSAEYPLGLDYLGRDALSRVLWGGRTVILLAVLATVLGYTLGFVTGFSAAYFRGWVDELAMRATELMLAFPSLVFILVLVAAFGSSLQLLTIVVAITNFPAVARIVRAAALEVRDLPYVEAAEARGEKRLYIVLREILPNITAPILADFGLRLTGSILIVAGVSFLGFGLQPPAADWGLMVSENRAGLTVQPWPVVAAVAAIGVLMISINLIIDGYRRASRLGDIGVELEQIARTR